MKEARSEVLAEIARPAKRDGPTLRRRSLHRLKDLKQAFVGIYLDLHAKARLGINDDRRKTALMNDGRLARIEALAAIDLMPVRHLTDLQERLGGLKSCFALTKGEIEAAPVCPHCGFRPALEGTAVAAGKTLAHLDEKIDELLADWTRTLLANLDDPAIRENLSLLEPAQRKRIDSFVQIGELPDPLEPEFIEALREALSGLVKVVVRTEDLRFALLSGGSPARPDDMKKRFERHLDALTKGHELAKVRVVLE